MTFFVLIISLMESRQELRRESQPNAYDLLTYLLVQTLTKFLPILGIFQKILRYWFIAFWTRVCTLFETPYLLIVYCISGHLQENRKSCSTTSENHIFKIIDHLIANWIFRPSTFTFVVIITSLIQTVIGISNQLNSNKSSC